MTGTSFHIDILPAAKWLKTYWHAIEINEHSLTLYRADRSSESVLWHQIIVAPSLEKKLGFTRILVQTQKQRYIIAGLNKQNAHSCVALMVSQWVQQHHEALIAALNALRDFLAQPTFLRTSQWSEYDQLRQRLSLLLPDFPLEIATKESKQLYQKAQSFLDQSDALFTQARQHYVARMLQTYGTFFDTIESQPLTEQQRIASVILDDTNLVLAGAGTGKTSTLIAKAAFLIESGQAKPEDILVLAFAKKAQEELIERFESKGVNRIAVHTFHSLGLHILQSSLKKPPSLTQMAENSELRKGFVTDSFQKLIKNKEYRHALLHYLQRWDIPSVREFDDSDAVELNECKTLQDEITTHPFIARVADYLFQTGVRYQLNAPYEHQNIMPDGEIYHADLYLKDAQLYLDIVPINDDGNVDDALLAQHFHEKLVWKRSLHQHFHTSYLCFDAIDQQSTQWLKRLESALEPKALKRKQKSEKTILDRYQQRREFQQIPHLLTELLAQLRVAHFTDEQLHDLVAKSRNPEQLQAMLALVQPIRDLYVQRLQKEASIDFDDMIVRSRAFVEISQFKTPWKYILIDEFQDISASRAALVQSLLKANSESSLVGVGDDWQAIYRFAGSDVSLTTRFEQRFGAGQFISLDKTFRFNNQINDVASRFIQRNPEQLRKNLMTLRQADEPAVSLYLTENSAAQLIQVLEQLSEDPSSADQHIYVLARFHRQLPDESMRQILSRQFSQFKMSYDTVHASKGKEADVVIIVELNDEKFGFPAKIATNPFINAFLPEIDSYPYAEERRLFYVALTRAKNKVICIGREQNPSIFLKEFIDERYPVVIHRASQSSSKG